MPQDPLQTAKERKGVADVLARLNECAKIVNKQFFFDEMDL